MAVVHDHHLGSGRRRRHRACGAVARDPCGEGLGQHQGLVADIAGGVDEGIDPHRVAQPPAVAPRERVGLDAPVGQPAQDLGRYGRLAGAAQGEVADADHRDAGVEPSAPGDPPRGGGGPNPARRLQHEPEHGPGPSAAQIPPAGSRDAHGAGSRV